MLGQIVRGLGFFITADLNHFTSENHCRDCSNVLLTGSSYVHTWYTSILGPGGDTKLRRSLGQYWVEFPNLVVQTPCFSLAWASPCLPFVDIVTCQLGREGQRDAYWPVGILVTSSKVITDNSLVPLS